jgi:hypothetical protein
MRDRSLGKSTLVAFIVAEGGTGLSEPLAAAIRNARIFEWLTRESGQEEDR